VQARIPKISIFNNGNLPYELLICSSTIILNLGKKRTESNNQTSNSN